MFFPNEKMAKEIFPYNYYNEENYHENVGDIDESLKYIEKTKPDMKADLIEAIKNAGAYLSETTYDMELYALYYCRLDVEIGYKSIIEFGKQLKLSYNIDLHAYISISSIALAYQKSVREQDKKIEYF